MNNPILTHYVFGTTRSMLLGAGMCYAIDREKYTHIPLVLFIPSAYVGYQLYSNKEAVVRFVRDLRH
jgi:hypothetical protein